MSLILILSYRLKEVTDYNVLLCLEIHRLAHISGTRFRIVMGFGSKCRILNGQVDHIETQNLTLPTCDSYPLIMSHKGELFSSNSDGSLLLCHHC